METKQDIRKRILEARDSLPYEKRYADSMRINAKILSLPAYAEAEAVFCYVSFRSEVITVRLLLQALADGKRVYCPKVIADRRMEFYEIMAIDEFTDGFHGVLEPRPVPAKQFVVSKQFCEQLFTKEKAVLFLMPGAVFDKNKNRIGYGGGYYDTYLARCMQAGLASYMTTAALAFSVQVTESIVPEAHDIAPLMLITEQPDRQRGDYV